MMYLTHGTYLQMNTLKLLIFLIILLTISSCSSIYRKAGEAISEPSSINPAIYESFQFFSIEKHKWYNSDTNNDLSNCINSLETKNTLRKVALIKAIEQIKNCMEHKGWVLKPYVITITS